MTANKKYLTRSPWTRLSKIIIGFFGGYGVSLTLHLAVVPLFDPGTVLITAYFTAILLWTLLLLFAFLIKQAWKTWLLYLSLIALFTALILIF